MSNLPIVHIADLAAQISDQPELFSAPDAKAVVAARAFTHTGRWTMQDAELVFRIIAAWLNTGSMRKAADLCEVSRNTVSCVIRILEAAGKLEPLKTRFERRRLEVGMETLEWIGDVTERRDLEAIGILGRPGWVGVGIVSDKEAAQPPTSVTVHVHHATVDGLADPVAEYERMLRQARTAVVIDVESAVRAHKSLPTSPHPQPATGQATQSLPPAHLDPPQTSLSPDPVPGGGDGRSDGGVGDSDRTV